MNRRHATWIVHVAQPSYRAFSFLTLAKFYTKRQYAIAYVPPSRFRATEDQPESFRDRPAPRSAALCRTRRSASLPFCGRRSRGDRPTMRFNRGSGFRIGGRDGARPSQCFGPVSSYWHVLLRTRLRRIKRTLSKIIVPQSENNKSISKYLRQRQDEFRTHSYSSSLRGAWCLMPSAWCLVLGAQLTTLNLQLTHSELL